MLKHRITRFDRAELAQGQLQENELELEPTMACMACPATLERFLLWAADCGSTRAQKAAKERAAKAEAAAWQRISKASCKGVRVCERRQRDLPVAGSPWGARQSKARDLKVRALLAAPRLLLH